MIVQSIYLFCIYSHVHCWYTFVFDDDEDADDDDDDDDDDGDDGDDDDDDDNSVVIKIILKLTKEDIQNRSDTIKYAVSQLFLITFRFILL